MWQKYINHKEKKIIILLRQSWTLNDSADSLRLKLGWHIISSNKTEWLEQCIQTFLGHIYCFIKAIVFNAYHSHLEEGKIIWKSPNTSISDAFVNVICVFWKDNCFWSICRLFNLVFIWNMLGKTLCCFMIIQKKFKF